MTDVASVRLRNLTLSDSARVLSSEGGPAGAECFLALDAPLPVGSVLVWTEAGGTEHAVRVVRVVEGAGVHGVPGVYVAPASDADRARARRIGTEDLAPLERAQPQDDASQARSDADVDTAADGPAPQVGGFAVPAPVVEPEPSEPIDVGRPAGDAAEGGASTASARGGKRRKGRRRG